MKKYRPNKIVPDKNTIISIKNKKPMQTKSIRPKGATRGGAKGAEAPLLSQVKVEKKENKF